MNCRKNVSLLLASAMMSSSFTAFVSAKPYASLNKAGIRFQEVELPDARVKVYAIKEGAQEQTQIDLGNLKPGDRRSFVLPITDEATINSGLNEERMSAADLEDLQTRGEAVLAAFNALTNKGDYGDADNAKANTKALIKAVEWMAEVKGECSGKVAGAALVKLARKIAFQVSEATKDIDPSVFHGDRALPGEDFDKDARGLEAGAEDLDAEGIAGNSLCMQANGGVNAVVRMGICVGDVFEAGSGLQQNLKYKVISTGDTEANGNFNDATAVNGCTVTGAVAVDGTVIDAVQDKGAADAKVVAAAGFNRANTFFSGRKDVKALANDAEIIAANKAAEAQLKDVAKNLASFFAFRVREFLQPTETAVANKALVKRTGAQYLGGGAEKDQKTNLPTDYAVAITKQTKGKGQVAVNYSGVQFKINGVQTPALLVTFAATGTPEKDTEVAGEVTVLGSASNKATFSFKGKVAKFAKNAEEAKKFVSAVLEENEGGVMLGTKIDKSIAKEINEQYKGQPVTLTAKDADGDEVISITYKDGKNVQPGELTLGVEKSNTDANKVAKELTGVSMQVTMVNLPKNFKGNAEVSISLEALGLNNMKNGTKLYFTPVDADDLQKISKLASQARASADDDDLMGDSIEGRVEDGKVKLTLNAADIDDKDTLLLTTQELDQKKLEANNNKAEDAAEDAEEEETTKKGAAGEDDVQDDDDLDGDGIPDSEEDLDGNGIPDAEEDRDGNGIPDALEDKDGNGIPDIYEEVPVKDADAETADGVLAADGARDVSGNAVPETGAAASAAAFAVASLAAGAVAIKKSKK